MQTDFSFSCLEMIDFFRAVRFYLIPRHSFREKLYHNFRVVWVSIRLFGLGTTIKRITSVVHDRIRKGRSSAWSSRFYSYADWIRENEPDPAELARQRSESGKFTYQPLISILTPVYNPEPDVLRETIQSVIRQTYPNWELCLANASDREEVREVIDQMAAAEPRLRPIHLQKNLGIAGNTNQALKTAAGEFIALLDHDDLVSPNLLYEAVQVFDRLPDTDLVYYDEDKVSADGKNRRDPWFKPTFFSPDLLISINYLMHSIIRKSMVLELGGFDSRVDGAQDWDLALKIVDHTHKIVHIPKVMYHWRQVMGSAARDANAKPWAFSAQLTCIQNYLTRQGYPNSEVKFESLGVIRVHWPTHQQMVSIIIPTRNNLAILKACLASILNNTTYPNYEVLVVDNNSTDPEVFVYYSELEKKPNIKILSYQKPYNYQKINNYAANYADGEIFVFLNNDTEILASDWLAELVGQAARPEIGAVGTKLLRPNQAIQHGGMIVGLLGHASHIFEDCPDHYYSIFGSTDWYRNYQSVTGACMAVPRQVFEQIGGFDETYLVGYGDIDLCLRIFDAGYRVIYTPFARVLHYEGGTRGLSLPPSDVLRATAYLENRVEVGDPFYNPNLSYLHRQPTLAQPQEESRTDRLVRILGDFDLIHTPLDSDLWGTNLLVLPVASELPTNFTPERVENILLVTHELSRSGAPIILAMLAESLKTAGFQLKVISPVNGSLREQYDIAGIPVFVEPRLLDDARLIQQHMNDYDTILVNTILGWRTVHAARAFNRRCLWWVHESNFGKILADENTAVQSAFRAADLVMFPSQATADLYQEFTNHDNYRVAHSGLDVSTLVSSSDPVPFKKEPGKISMVMVATFETRKGQDILIEAMSLLEPDIAQRVHLFLIGRHYLDRSFYRKVSRHARRLKNVTIVGELSNQEVLSYLRNVDVFVLTSRDEALPISLIEAMAMGKMIITTAAGGINEILQDGVNSYVVDVADAEELSERITRIVKNPDKIKELGEQARQTYLNKHTVEAFSLRVQEIIEELPKLKTPPAPPQSTPIPYGTSLPFTQEDS